MSLERGFKRSIGRLLRAACDAPFLNGRKE